MRIRSPWIDFLGFPRAYSYYLYLFGYCRHKTTTVNALGSVSTTSVRAQLSSRVVHLEIEPSVVGVVCSAGNLGSIGLTINSTSPMHGLGQAGGSAGDAAYLVGGKSLGCNMHLARDGYDFERHFPDQATSLGHHEEVRAVRAEPTRGFTLEAGEVQRVCSAWIPEAAGSGHGNQGNPQPDYDPTLLLNEARTAGPSAPSSHGSRLLRSSASSAAGCVTAPEGATIGQAIAHAVDQWKSEGLYPASCMPTMRPDGSEVGAKRACPVYVVMDVSPVPFYHLFDDLSFRYSRTASTAEKLYHAHATQHAEHVRALRQDPATSAEQLEEVRTLRQFLRHRLHHADDDLGNTNGTSSKTADMQELLRLIDEHNLLGDSGSQATARTSGRRQLWWGDDGGDDNIFSSVVSTVSSAASSAYSAASSAVSSAASAVS